MHHNIQYKIWINKEQESFLGKGKVELLREIADKKSLNKAAKTLNISYKKAWTMLKTLNETSQTPATIQMKGGKNGGGTLITPYGLHLIDTYDLIWTHCKTFLDEEIKKHTF